MSQTRFSLVSPATRISFSTGPEDALRARKVSEGSRRTVARKVLAVRVPKGGELFDPARASASFVVGLSFAGGSLVVELLNNGRENECRVRAPDLVNGPAFERFANWYVSDSARLVIGPELLTASLYELNVRSDRYGDLLTLTEKTSGANRYGKSLVVNLSTLFAIGPLTVFHDGRVTYDPEVVATRMVANGELFPFLACVEPPAGWHDFVVRGWESFTRQAGLLEQLQRCEATWLDARGGSYDRALAAFKRLLADLA